MGGFGAPAIVTIPGVHSEGGLEARIKIPALFRGQLLPEFPQDFGIRCVLPLQPFQVGAAHQVSHVATAKTRVAVEGAVVRQLALQRPLPQHRGAIGAVGSAAAGDFAFDDRRVAFDHPARRLQGHRAHGQIQQFVEKGWPVLGPSHVLDVGQFVGHQQLGPSGVVADGAIAFRWCLPQFHEGMLQQRKGRAIGLPQRIPDEHVHRARRLEAHPGNDPGVDAFNLRSHFLGEGLKASAPWIVDAVVGRPDRLPRCIGGLHSLRMQRAGEAEQGGESGSHRTSVTQGPRPLCDFPHLTAVRI